MANDKVGMVYKAKSKAGEITQSWFSLPPIPGVNPFIIRPPSPLYPSELHRQVLSPFKLNGTQFLVSSLLHC